MAKGCSVSKRVVKSGQLIFAQGPAREIIGRTENQAFLSGSIFCLMALLASYSSSWVFSDMALMSRISASSPNCLAQRTTSMGSATVT